MPTRNEVLVYLVDLARNDPEDLYDLILGVEEVSEVPLQEWVPPTGAPVPLIGTAPPADWEPEPVSAWYVILRSPCTRVELMKALREYTDPRPPLLMARAIATTVMESLPAYIEMCEDGHRARFLAARLRDAGMDAEAATVSGLE